MEKDEEKKSQIYQIIGSTQIIISVIILHKCFEYKQQNDREEWRMKKNMKSLMGLY